MKRMSHPIIVCGLTSILAFGAVGCSSSSTSTTEVSTTDENGNTTTTTTTTTTDESGKETTETSTVTTDADGNVVEDGDDAASVNGYTNDYYKVGLEIPEGFSDVTNPDDQPEGMQLEFEIANEDDTANASILLVPSVTSEEGITDIDSWASSFGEALVSSLEEQGAENIDTQFSDFSIAGTPYGDVYIVTCTLNDVSTYYDLYFILDDDGDGMLIQLYAQSEDDINTLRDSLRAL